MRCVYCGSTRIVVNENGEYVCADCGTVQPFANTDVQYQNMSVEVNHWGPPLSFSLSSELVTNVDTSTMYKINSISRRLNAIKIAKLRQVIALDAVQTVISNVSQILRMYENALGLDKADNETITQCVLAVRNKYGRIPRRNLHAVVAACIYVLNLTGRIRVNVKDYADLLNLFGIRHKQLFTFVDYVANILNVDMLDLMRSMRVEDEVRSVFTMLSRYINYSDSVSPGQIYRTAVSIARRAIDMFGIKASQKKRKLLIIAAVLYTLMELYNQGKIDLRGFAINQIAYLFGVSTAVLIRHINLIRNMANNQHGSVDASLLMNLRNYYDKSVVETFSQKPPSIIESVHKKLAAVRPTPTSLIEGSLGKRGRIRWPLL